MLIWIFPKNLIFSPLFVLDYFVDDTGMRRSDLLNQYLKDIEDQIETEEDLAEKKTLVDKVLDRLINKVRMQPHIIQSSIKYQLKVFPSLFHSTTSWINFLTSSVTLNWWATIYFLQIFMESYLLSNIITCSSFAIFKNTVFT